MPMGFSVLTVTMCIDEDAVGAGGGVTRGGDRSYSILTGGGIGSATGCCKMVGIIVGVDCGVGT